MFYSCNDICQIRAIDSVGHSFWCAVESDCVATSPFVTTSPLFSVTGKGVQVNLALSPRSPLQIAEDLPLRADIITDVNPSALARSILEHMDKLKISELKGC